jgi:hypothetical protein
MGEQLLSVFGSHIDRGAVLMLVIEVGSKVKSYVKALGSDEMRRGRVI